MLQVQQLFGANVANTTTYSTTRSSAVMQLQQPQQQQHMQSGLQSRDFPAIIHF